MSPNRKILLFMRHAGYVRNFDATLIALAERGHELHIAVDHTAKANLPQLQDQLEALTAAHPTFSWGVTPERKGGWKRVTAELCQALDYWRYLRPEFASAPALRARAGSRAPGWATWLTTLRLMRSERALDLICGLAKRALAGVPRAPEVSAYIEAQAPDLVVITPLVEIGSPQLEYLRCAKALGLPTCLMVASWDHLTTKGLIHELPDTVTVWNPTQRREAVELHGVPAERIVVTGAVAYDHWFDWQPTRDRAEFCGSIGLDPDRPFVLYLGSSGFIAPSEGAFIADWIRGIRAVPGAGLDDLQILVRPHPQNASARKFGVHELPGVAVYPLEGANPTSEQLRNDYFDSLHHCAAAIGINSSSMIEAAIVGRPVHTLLAPQYWKTQRGSLHFRYLLPENGGMLKVASTIEQQAPQIARSLADGAEEARENMRLIEHFIRPHGIDVLATPRLVETIETLAGSAPRDRTGAEAEGSVLAWFVRVGSALFPGPAQRGAALGVAQRALAVLSRIGPAFEVLRGRGAGGEFAARAEKQAIRAKRAASTGADQPAEKTREVTR